MPKLELRLIEPLPRIGYFVSFLYSVKVDGKDAPGALKVDFNDDFLDKFYAKPISGPNPVKFDTVNLALLSEVGSLRVRAKLDAVPADEIIQLCAAGGEKPIETISSVGVLDRSLDDMVARLRKEAK